MGLRQFLMVLGERWRSLVAVVVLGLVATGVLIFLTPTTYQSTATLLITTPTTTGFVNTQAAIITTQERVVSYAEMAQERGVLAAAADRLDDVTTDELDDRVSSEVVAGTLLIKIAVEGDSPEEAQEAAAVVADETLKAIDKVEAADQESVRLPFSAVLASEPRAEDTPHEPRMLIAIGTGVVLSVLLGLCVAVLREVLETTIADPARLRAATNHALVTVVPQDPAAVDGPAARGPASEAFRVLRTNLQFADLEVPRPIVLVTSPAPGEGRTFVATGLALAMAGAGRSVLLIDADLRHPGVADRLDIDGTTGLVSVLVGKVPLEDALVEHSSGVTVLPSGPIPPNPAEMMESAAMRGLLAAVRGRYDLVVIDAPAVLPTADASILMAEADGALLVARHGVTRREEARLASERIAAVYGRLFGVVLNGSPRAAAAYGYDPVQPEAGRRARR